MMMDNGGIFVCKCRHLVLAGASQSKAGGQGVGGGGGLPGSCQLVVTAITRSLVILYSNRILVVVLVGILEE